MPYLIDYWFLKCVFAKYAFINSYHLYAADLFIWFRGAFVLTKHAIESIINRMDNFLFVKTTNCDVSITLAYSLNWSCQILARDNILGWYSEETVACMGLSRRFKGHWKRFPKLVEMLVLYIKINFNQRYIKFFLRNKVTLVLKLALLSSHMAETLIENLRKTLECDVIFAKQRPQRLCGLV